MDLERPEQVLSIYLDRGRALLGVTSARHDATRSRAATVLSRAEHKLAEALRTFGIRTRTGTTAIDLGAAPGGWSYLLAERGVDVMAVDPGALAPIAASHRRIKHLPVRAERLDLGGRGVELIVNDMNLDPTDSARVMCAVAPHLPAGGDAIMTVKLPQRSPWPGIAAAQTVLRTAYDVLALRHLPHNRQEVTAHLRRR